MVKITIGSHHHARTITIEEHSLIAMALFRHIAPSGTDIKLSELFGWAKDIVLQRDKTSDLTALICKKYGVKHCFIMSSARAGLAMLFTMLKRESTNSAKTEIILPTYTCYSLPAAVEIAGLTVRLCDIDKKTLSYDLNALRQMDFTHVLAIVSANLFGNPDDLSEIAAIAKEHNIVFIDDAAQAMNAKTKDQYAGTFGDIGLYSLDKGKNITSIQGGIIVTNDDNFARSIEADITALPKTNAKQKLLESIKLIIYSILLKPWLYWIPANIPALGLGKTIYTTDYLYTQYSSHLSSISYRLFLRIDPLTNKRCDNHQQLTIELGEIPGVHILGSNNKQQSACLRCSILIENESIRDDLIKDLIAHGIGASYSYQKSLDQLDEITTFRSKQSIINGSGKYVADHILTIPTSTMLQKDDIRTITGVFNKYKFSTP